MRVVIEAKLDYKKKQQATKAADDRLRSLTNVAFALCYPKGATEGSLPSDQLTWQLRTSTTDGSDWTVGNVAQLAEALRQAPSSIGDVDKAAQVLSDGLNTAVQRISTPTREALARRIDLPAEGAKDQKLLDKRMRTTDGYFISAKRGLLVIATAMLFHERLHTSLPDLQPESWTGDWPPLSPQGCAAEVPGTMQRFRSAWQAILAVDYRPIFATAIAALDVLEAQPDHSQAIHSLAMVVSDVAERIAGIHQDLLGRIFHRVLDTARYDGSFYTSTAAAALLAGMALRPEGVDWSDADTIASLRICDPACGTGTLLMAAADRVRHLRRSAGPMDPQHEEALALCLVEDVLWGYDINLTGTHLAAAALGMLSPTTRFERLRIYRTLLGVYDGTAYVGSLEVSAPDKRMRIIPWPHRWDSWIQGSLRTRQQCMRSS